MYHWPAGAVTEADVSRFWPWTDDRCLIAEVTAGELDADHDVRRARAVARVGDASAEPPAAADRHTSSSPRDYVDWATVQIERSLGRELVWRPLDVRLRDALRTRSPRRPFQRRSAAAPSLRRHVAGASGA